jgi:hypothetical protein
VDERGAASLAAVGEERGSCDGHYVYTAREPFTMLRPLPTCSNQKHVIRWLGTFLGCSVAPDRHISDHAPPRKRPAEVWSARRAQSAAQYSATSTCPWRLFNGSTAVCLPNMEALTLVLCGLH